MRDLKGIARSWRQQNILVMGAQNLLEVESSLTALLEAVRDEERASIVAYLRTGDANFRTTGPETADHLERWLKSKR
jgi:hypothetical protein